MTERVLICGSRDYTNEAAIESVLFDLPAGTTVVHGAARGVDEIAGRLAENLGFPVEPHPADWEKWGKAAGPIRNREMLETGVDRVIAFWDGRSPGTKHMIDAAKAAGVPVVLPAASPKTEEQTDAA